MICIIPKGYIRLVTYLIPISYICNTSTMIYYKITWTNRSRHLPPGTKKHTRTCFSFCARVFSSLFQLSWFEVLSGATAFPVGVTGLQLSCPDVNAALRQADTVNLPHRSTNQENELTCNSIFQPEKVKLF